jgi:hypothetical protein
MSQSRNQRRFFLIAAIAIGIALLLMLLQPTHAGFDLPLLILLPILFIGVLPSPCLLSRIAYMQLGYTPDDPALPTSFQRPPPYSIA